MSLSLVEANTLVVLDFETTGLSVRQGARPIEIGAVKLVDGIVVDRFQELMNPGVRVDHFIEGYTGISNQMLATARPCAEVMADFADFIVGCNLLAHNASFDRAFLQEELVRLGRRAEGEFLCTLLLSRRLYPEAGSHKLANLVAYKNIANDGVFHRALADAEVTARLWLRMLEDVRQNFNLRDLTFAEYARLQKLPKAKVAGYLASLAAA
ncbi:DNA polymerase-3 subunit epsilon [Sinobacterium caligoides]|uniref:DNA-directed DNA polymerase n=1 Tax=Sinobacterium caligoides TaxID=933926 RepID=A0A3N2DY29_9GAMM|nr:3'-5' exonuclease [Sinobacterium caligoides]ROS04741.1 DNA polymerase-3 subunit epsilon [Sinobacterium caligoides]